MDTIYRSVRSHLFTVRVWKEEVKVGEIEWRGKIQLTTGGEVRYFHGWNELAPLLIAMLQNIEPPAEAK